MLEVIKALNKWQRRTFAYGDADCCQFAAFIVNELSGKNYISSFVYDSESSANEVIAKNGGLLQTVSSVLGEPDNNFLLLKDGSPVLVNYNNLELLGVKLNKKIICLTKHGFAQLNSKYFIAGWPECLK